MGIATIVIEDIPGGTRHRRIENEFDPVWAAEHLLVRFYGRYAISELLRPFKPRGHVQQVLDRDGFLSRVDIGNFAMIEKILYSMTCTIEQAIRLRSVC